ncbi:hypothetical protein LINGRAHAP2_LOCUS20814, partial [Linum grandiflorum]
HTSLLARYKFRSKFLAQRFDNNYKQTPLLLPIQAMVCESEQGIIKITTIKFLCSYGGKIVPRSTDGKLRYRGGLTRVFAVHRSLSFPELMVKLGEFCGQSVELKCQLPNGDLETLISIKSDEELANLFEEYDRCSPGSKIRAVLSLPKTASSSPTPSETTTSNNGSSPSTPEYFRPSACGFHSPTFGYRAGASGKGHYSPIGIGQQQRKVVGHFYRVWN